MKICFISQAFGELRGGNEVFASLFEFFWGRHEVVVITDKTKDTNTPWRTELITPWTMSNYYALSSYFFARAAVKKLRELLARESFDLIVVNQVTAMPMRVANNLGIPAVFIIHHPISADIELALSESTRVMERLSWRFRYGNARATQKKLIRCFDHVLTVSEASQHKIATDYGVNASKIRVIHNGIDTDFYRKTKATIPKTVLSLGSYQHPRRGFPYLLGVYKKLSELGYHIHDVGRRTDEQGALLGVIPNVVQHELVSRESVPDFYSEASVFISTSLYEGFGLAIAESFSCETPAVAFGVGGIVDVMTKIAPEFICTPKDIDEMIRKIQKITNGGAGVSPSQLRARVVEHFSIQGMARSYEDYFVRLITTQDTRGLS